MEYIGVNELFRRSPSSPRSPTTSMPIWRQHHQHPQHPQQASRTFSLPTSKLPIDDVHYCSFCLSFSHPSMQCTALPPQIHAALINKREVNYFRYREALDDQRRILTVTVHRRKTVLLRRISRAQSMPRTDRTIHDHLACHRTDTLQTHLRRNRLRKTKG